MRLNEYQSLASRTANSQQPLPLQLANYALGLTGEAGEVADIIKKGVFHGHSMDKHEIEKEIGDVLWYVANLCELLHIELDNVAIKNLDKLRKRYPQGFSQNDSINRKE